MVLLLTITILTNSVELINAVENNQNTNQSENTDAYVENAEPVKPVITLKRNKAKVIVTIKNQQEDTQYQIYVKKRGRYKRIKTIRKNKYSFKFDKGELCRVKVRAAKKIDGKTVFSDFAKKTSDFGLTNADNWSDAYKVMHKYLKNNNQYMGKKGRKNFYLYEDHTMCFITVKNNYDITGVGHPYWLEYIKKVTNHNPKVIKSYNVKFVSWGDTVSYGMYGKMYIMKNGKIILKLKSGRILNKKLKVRKKYRIVLKELDEYSKILF